MTRLTANNSDTVAEQSSVLGMLLQAQAVPSAAPFAAPFAVPCPVPVCCACLLCPALCLFAAPSAAPFAVPCAVPVCCARRCALTWILVQDPQGGEPVPVPILVEQRHLIDESYLQVGGAAGVATTHSHAASKQQTARRVQYFSDLDL
jgi:hypothetical protein